MYWKRERLVARRHTISSGGSHANPHAESYTQWHCASIVKLPETGIGIDEERGFQGGESERSRRGSRESDREPPLLRLLAAALRYRFPIAAFSALYILSAPIRV